MLIYRTRVTGSSTDTPKALLSSHISILLALLYNECLNSSRGWCFRMYLHYAYFSGGITSMHWNDIRPTSSVSSPHYVVTCIFGAECGVVRKKEEHILNKTEIASLEPWD